MKSIFYKRCIASWLAVLCLAMGCSGQDDVPQPLRIMALGDSITAGYTDNAAWNEPFEFGYRSYLYKQLTDAGYKVQYVGESKEPWNGVSGDPSRGGTVIPRFDLREIGQDKHRGYGGAAAASLQRGIVGWLKTDDPHVILLKAGTNSYDTKALNKLVDTITTEKPEAHLIIAGIMPKWTYQQAIIDYNTYIREELVPKFQAQGKLVAYVDQYVNFLSDRDDVKSIEQARISNRINHPDNVGYERMAKTWFEAIEAIDFDARAKAKPQEQAAGEPDEPIKVAVVSNAKELAYKGDVSGEDLLHGLTPKTTGWNLAGGSHPDRLTDGKHGASYKTVPGESVQGAWTTAGATAEYELGKGEKGQGYDLTSIVSIADWNSANFGNQAWTIEFKRVGETGYTLLAKVDAQPLAGMGGTKATLTNTQSGVLASGVQSIRITANEVNEGALYGAFVWRELDIFGKPTGD